MPKFHVCTRKADVVTPLKLFAAYDCRWTALDEETATGNTGENPRKEERRVASRIVEIAIQVAYF